MSARNFNSKNNFCARGRSRTLVEIDRKYSDEDVVWQEEVYVISREIVLSRNISRVIDIGTGAGAKFYQAFQDSSIKKIQIDWSDRREIRETDSFEFIAANFEDPDDLEMLYSNIEHRESSVFILSDVIEHLIDPRYLLRVLRRLLRQNPSNRLIISTPDRDRIDGENIGRAPDNPSHVRQWNINEFNEAITSAGFKIEAICHVKQNKYDLNNRTICSELSCDDYFYKKYLLDNQLPPAVNHIAITTEHAYALSTGGIGSYHHYSELATGERKIYLFTGSSGLPTDWLDFVRTQGWVHVAELCGKEDQKLEQVSRNDCDEILFALISLLFIYDEVSIIEYQDYLGIGSRVAQAKRARLIPSTITVCVYAHGSQFYLDNAAGNLVNHNREFELDVRERISLEQADVAIFPSNFLHDLYANKQGLKFRSTIFQPYPIKLDTQDDELNSFKPIDTLIFYGKQTSQKGYPEFCDAIINLFTEVRYRDVAAQIKKIHLMGVTSPDKRLTQILSVDLRFGSYSLAEAVSQLSANAQSSLVILPYKGDNHPLSVFEVVNTRSQLLSFSTGGVPEILPSELHSDLLCNPDSKSLAEAISKNIQRSFWERTNLIINTSLLLKRKYDAVIDDFKSNIALLKNQPLKSPVARGEVGVIVPNLNGSERFFADLSIGIRNSFLPPKEIVFIDDGSDEFGQRCLTEGVKNLGNIPYSVIFNAENIGLAATRNEGLRKISTPYVCAHDNDNILLNRYLDLACRILDENPDVAAVTGWSWAFQDETSWATHREKWEFDYRPLGQDLGLLLQKNCVGDALAVYRTEILQQIGGWEGSSKAQWEDWQLFTKMTALGHKIWVIPDFMFLYRVRPSSMLRTYPKFPGQLRLASALEAVPKADAVSVIRAMKQLNDLTETAYHNRLRPHEYLWLRQERMKSIAHRARTHVSFERQIQEHQSWSNHLIAAGLEQRQERMKAVAHRARTHISFEKQLNEMSVSYAIKIVNEKRYLWREMIRSVFLAARNCVQKIMTSGGFMIAIQSINSSYRENLITMYMNINAETGGSDMYYHTGITYVEARRLIEVSGLFEKEWYLSRYEHLKEFSGDLIEHYLLNASTDRLSPGPLFDGDFYIRTNPDVELTGINPLVHFLLFGADEGRWPASAE